MTGPNPTHWTSEMIAKAEEEADEMYNFFDAYAERQRFEEAMLSTGEDWKHEDGTYAYRDIQRMWLTWQAARSASEGNWRSAAEKLELANVMLSRQNIELKKKVRDSKMGADRYRAIADRCVSIDESDGKTLVLTIVKDALADEGFFDNVVDRWISGQVNSAA